MCWDAALVRAWLRNWNLKTLCAKFMVDHSGDWGTIDSLRRAPTIRFGNPPTRAFVATALPKLNDILWGGKYSPEEVTRWLSNSGLRSRKLNERNNSRKRSRYRRKVIKTEGDKVVREELKRTVHDWRTVKAFGKRH